ncbi:MAG: hypothetical protein QM784_33040 [Polyangiaceae bacterium]
MSFARHVSTNRRKCLSVLRVLVLGIVLAFFPAKASAWQPCSREVPVVVAAAASTQSVKVTAAHAFRQTVAEIEPQRSATNPS